MELNALNNKINDYADVQIKQSSVAPNVDRNAVKEDYSKEVKNNKNDQMQDADISKLKTVINRANTKMQTTQKRFEFSYHEKTKRVSIKVYDKETDQVIREIPPEESLEMIEKLWEIAGLFVDESR